MAGRSKWRKLLAERLEDRSLMAGVVAVTLANNEFSLVAVETAANESVGQGIQITYMGFNEYTITSRPTGSSPNDRTQFLFNGQTVQSIQRLFVPNSADLYVNLRNGDDVVYYTQSSRDFTTINFRDAAIDLGYGRTDELNVEYLRLSRDWKIWGGQADNQTQGFQPQNPIVNLGLGGDNVVGRDFCYFGGDGIDDFTMRATTIGDDVQEPPPPRTQANPLTYRLACLASPMVTNEGNDIVTIQNRPTGPVTVVDAFVLDTGDGDDRVSVTGLTVDQLLFLLGDGDDTVFFQSTTIAGDSEVDGEAGYDLHTESTAAPRNNFDGTFTLDTDRTLVPPATPPFPPANNRASPTATNPNSAYMRFVNFENGLTRPPGSNPNNPNNPNTPTGGRWVLRRQGAVEVNTSASPNLSNLQNMVSNNGAPTQPTASVVNNRLQISGTDDNDLILVSDAGNGRVRVRVGSRQLGVFNVGEGLAVNSYGGSDTVYVADTISVATMIGASLADDMVVGSPNMIINDNGRTFSNRHATEHARQDPHTPAVNDAALLLIVGPADVYSTDNGHGFGDL